MRIGIDISVLCDKWEEFGTYVYEQLKYTERNDKENEFFLYADRPLATELRLGDQFHICVDNGGGNHLVWLLTRLPKYAKRDRIDVFWQPNFILPFRIPGMRSVVSVHDMSAFAYSGYASTKTNIVHKLFLKPTCRKADKILAISQNGASEIEKYLRVEASKIQTIYIGKKMFEDGLDATRRATRGMFEKIRYSRERLSSVCRYAFSEKKCGRYCKRISRISKNGRNQKVVAGR